MTDIRIKIDDIIGTKTRVFSAYEPSQLMGDHTNLTTFDDAEGWWGRLGSERNVPPEIMAMKSFSEERLKAARAWSAKKYERAYAAILAAHPEAVDGKRSMGSIEIERA